MKSSHLVCYWPLVLLVATRLPASEFEVCNPARAGFNAAKLAMIRPAMERHIEEGKLVGGIGLGFRIDKDGTYGWGGAAGTRFWIHPKNKLITIYMVQIKPTARFNFGGEMKKLVYASMQ